MLNNIITKILLIISELKYRLALLNHRKKLPVLPQGDRLILDHLKRDGAYVISITDLALPSTEKLLKTARMQLAQIPKADHDDLAKKMPQIHTITDLPEITAWGTEPRLLNLIENYIGLPITYHGVHLRKDFPSEHQFDTLLWHKDAEDRRIIKIFLYLEDVEEKHGPFEYIPKSLISIWNSYRINLQLKRSRYLGITDQIVEKIIPRSAWKSCPGVAGTVIIGDTRNILHHGTLRIEERSALFFCYTATPPKRPELCTQYWDSTFPHIKPQLSIL
jgi:hypothetical protein